MFFFYTRYKDISVALPASVNKMMELIIMSRWVEEQKVRDARLREVLKKKDLHNWPKKKGELDNLQNRLLQLYREYNDNNLAIFLVIKDDHDTPERECHMLADGVWKSFKDIKTATEALYGLEENCECVNHRVVCNP
jgi:hypothetical protein